jgi:hypothetical protein
MGGDIGVRGRPVQRNLAAPGSMRMVSSLLSPKTSWAFGSALPFRRELNKVEVGHAARSMPEQDCFYALWVRTTLALAPCSISCFARMS